MTARSWALAVLALACACKPPPTDTKTADDMPPSGSSVDPLGDAESRIADNAARMRALGIELAETRDDAKKPDTSRDIQPTTVEPTKPASDPRIEKGRRRPSDDPRPPQTTPTTPPEPVKPQPGNEPPATKQTGEDDRCEQICELADVACGLEAQVCRLADLHVGAPRYEDACWRARDQCERGRDACDECSAAC
ncbi:MAG TPA: hypothetical protein VG755_07800 [Nannocystaceae bacterium]|nr:hypothetical protein [Nannocystaceae bacterium]